MKPKFHTGDQVTTKFLEVIDVDGHRTADRETVIKYLLSDGRHYLESELQPVPKLTKS
jgi:hypothetical protein